MSDDDLIRERCKAREEHLRIIAGYLEAVENAQTKLATAETELSNTKNELADTQNELATTQSELANALAYIAKLEAERNS